MFSIILGVMLMSLGVVFATRPDAMPNQARNSFTIPDKAVEVSPGVFYLGKALDKGRVVEGYAFMMKDSQDNKARKPRPPTEDPCYTFLASGAKWKTIEPYIVDPRNIDGLNEEIVRSNLALDIGKWEISGNYD